jgi:hypothetical protein
MFVLAPKMAQIPYSQFEQFVQEGRIKEVRIGPEIITGIFKRWAPDQV